MSKRKKLRRGPRFSSIVLCIMTYACGYIHFVWIIRTKNNTLVLWTYMSHGCGRDLYLSHDLFFFLYNITMFIVFCSVDHKIMTINYTPLDYGDDRDVCVCVYWCIYPSKEQSLTISYYVAPINLQTDIGTYTYIYV